MNLKIPMFAFIFLTSTAVFPNSEIDKNPCIQKVNTKNNSYKNYVKFAEGFKVYSLKDQKIVEVKNSFGEERLIYVLKKKNGKIIKECRNYPTFEVPISRLISLSTTYLPMIDTLKIESNLVAVGDSKWVNTESISKMIKNGLVKEVGFPPNPEITLSLDPELILTYPTSSPSVEGITKLIKMGLKVVYAPEYLEKTALARGEWIKFVALFFNKEKEAEQFYNRVVENYESANSLVKELKNRPVVMVGKSTNGIWTAPGGKSYLSKLIEDSGGKYLWDNTETHRSITLQMENIFEIENTVSIWLPQNNWGSINDIILEDERYKKLKVFSSNKIYNNNAKVNKDGGNDYWETGIIRPDLLLMDLIKIIHPDLVPNHNLIWYKKL